MVAGRVIVTRSVDPNAYEHVARALLYEEEERCEDAILELRRALNFDRDAPEVHARIAELHLELEQVGDAERAVQGLAVAGETRGRARGRGAPAPGARRPAGAVALAAAGGGRWPASPTTTPQAIETLPRAGATPS